MQRFGTENLERVLSRRWDSVILADQFEGLVLLFPLVFAAGWVALALVQTWRRPCGAVSHKR